MNNSLHRFDTFAAATDNSTLSLCLMDWLPKWVVRLFVVKAPIKRLEHLRMSHDLIGQVAKELLIEKYEALAADKPKRDIMSLLGMFPLFGVHFTPAEPLLASESKCFGKPEDPTQ